MRLLRWSLSLVFVLGCSPASAQGVLDDFINKQDQKYSYNIVNRFSAAGADVYLLRMTSQQWRDAETFDSTKAPFQEIWSHDMYVIVPPVIVSKTASLVIGGGSRNTDPYGFISPDNESFRLSLASLGRVARY